QSRWNIIGSAMKSAILMVLFVMVIGEWVAPLSEAKAKEIRTQAISGGSLFSSSRLVWAKDGDNFVSIGEVIDKDTLRDVNIYEFDSDLLLRQITTAKNAQYLANTWRLQDITYTYLSLQHIRVEEAVEDTWTSSITPEKLGVVTVKPEALSIRGLLDYIGYLDNNGQNSDRYRLALWRKILQPVSVGVMLLMALSFIFGPLRSVTMGARVIMGVLTGFGFFVSNEVFGALSTVYHIAPFVGAALPSLLFATTAVYLIRR
ncbi:MAG: lipopolysaccharide export system permease protein, partial [Paraglaciecola sp.]